MPSYVGDNLVAANYLGDKLVCGENLLLFRAVQAGVNGEWKAIHAAAVGTNVYSARDTVATVIDHEGLVREVPDYTIRPQNARIVENLADGNETQNITVVSGGKYWVSVEAGETGTVTCSNAFTGDITGSATNRKTWADDTIRTAASTTLTLTVSGTIAGLFVEDVTGSSVQDAPSEYVSDSQNHGLFSDGIKAFATSAHNNSVTSGVVTEGTASGDISDDIYYLAEPSATNVIKQSEDFTNDSSNWTDVGNITAVETSAVSSVQSCNWWDLYCVDTTTGTKSYYSNSHTKAAASEQWVGSIYVKKNEYDWCMLRIGNSNGTKRTEVYFDLTNGISGTTSSVTWTLDDYGIEEVLAGEYRIWSKNTTDTEASIRLSIYIADADNDRDIPASQDEGIYIAGAQLVKENTLSSYIATSGSAVTRSADLVKFDIANNFNQDAGTVIFTWITAVAQANRAATDLGLVTSSDSATGLSYFDSGGVRTTDGTTIATVDPTYVADNKYRIGVRWGASTMQIGLRDVAGAGSWNWSADTNYDDSYALGNYLNLLFGVTAPEQMKDLYIYQVDKGTDWIEANY